jgi:hypothetical protein
VSTINERDQSIIHAASEIKQSFISSAGNSAKLYRLNAVPLPMQDLRNSVTDPTVRVNQCDWLPLFKAKRMLINAKIKTKQIL